MAGIARQQAVIRRRRQQMMMMARAATGARRAFRAARTIQRNFRVIRRRYKGFTKGRIGQSAQSRANAKTHEASNLDGDLRASRTLYYYDLTNIAEGSTINLRQKQQVYLAGVKICFQWENEQDIPLTMNFAVVHDKQSNNAVTAINVNDFFRATGATSRNTDFSNVLTNNELHCNNLNTDRFTVLRHKRYLIGTKNNASGNHSNTRSSYGQIHDWISVRRKVTYEDTHCQSKIWIMYWFDRFQDPAAQIPVPNVAKISQHFKVYFREPILGA